MICDWDDHCIENDALPWMFRLKEVNPAFKATLFTIPSKCSVSFLDTHPAWIECVPHGWSHPSPHEAEFWGISRMRALLDEHIIKYHFPVRGWKSPGWLVSDGTYAALLERGYWIADHPKNNSRRPNGLRAHVLGDGDHWHGHVQDVCGNGLAETWAEVEALVRAADSFQFVSEVVK